jgi:ketosteroid isomerase-like protein
MPNEAANVAVLKDAYRQWHDSRGGSVDHWMSICADDINFGSLAQGAPAMRFAATYSNRHALQGYFEGLLADWEMIHYTVDEFVAQGDSVVMRGSTAWRNKRTGRGVDTPKVDFWRFRDGKAVEFYEYYDTARVFAAASP